VNGYRKYKALIPVKALSSAKSRLASYLSQNQRETLVLDMLHHLLHVLLDSELFEQVSVVSADVRVLEHAHLWGARPLIEEQHGHNPALHAAALRMQTVAAPLAGALAKEGFMSDKDSLSEALLTISADLPLLTTQEICCLLKQSAQYEVVLAPARDGTGTNAILVRPPLIVPYVFGPHSLHRYVEAASQKHLSHKIYYSTGLALDIDTIDDLHELETLNRNIKEIVYGC
jgi:2-phospho-L-lactate/phosphoenolpyruvate guanylyltransferase